MAKTRLTSTLLWLAGLAAVVLLVILIRSFTKEVVEVRVTPVTYENLFKTIPTNGKVEPIEAYQAHTLGPGVIQQIYVNVNDKVVPGTLLFRMNDSDAMARVATAKAQLAGAQVGAQDIANNGTLEDRQRFQQDLNAALADQQHAQAELDAQKKLLASGAVSAGEVLTRQQRLDSANAAVKNAQARLGTRYTPADRSNQSARLADARASISAADNQLANTAIRSPLAGTVYYIRYRKYEYVPSAELDVLDIADLTRVRVRAYFDEPEIGKLAAGQDVVIRWDARPERTWHGKVVQAPTVVQAYGNRSVGECIINIADARGDLLPNVTVGVSVTVASRQHVLSIPREALHTQGDANYVFRLGDGHLQRVNVAVGVVNLTKVEILSGLTDKDTIVLGPVKSGEDLTDGLAVKRVS